MNLIHKMVEYMAPGACLKCGVEGAVVCDGCLPLIVITKRSTCYRCNRLSDNGRTCPSCRSSSKLSGVKVASHYDGAVKEIIQSLKYYNLVSAAEVAAKLITPLLDTSDYDLVTAVPTASGRFRQRGYNQAELIARGVASRLALPYSSLLVRLGGAQQVGHGRLERIKQLDGNIVAIRTSLLKNARILVIDDVLTTGSTMSECAKILKAAGAKSVWGAVVAKH